MLQAAKVVDGRVLWANLALLFTLSLVPFATSWMGETVFAPLPTSIYGVVSLSSAMAYFVLVRTLIRVRGQTSTLARAVGTDRKGMLSPLLFAAGIPIALVAPAFALILYIVVVSLWIIPDLRIERALAE